MEQGVDAFAVVKKAIRLSDYVRRFTTVELRAQGANQWRTACIAHNGDNPTGMSVDDTKGLWWCFTGDCGGGSIIDLWMKMNGSTDKAAAIAGLADELSITLPQADEAQVSQQRMLNALAAVATAANALLLSDEKSDDLAKVRQYLRGREIGKTIVSGWEIGWIPTDRAAVSLILEACSDTPALVKAGVLKYDSTNDTYWAPMQGRITFPIADEQGNIIGFSARMVEGVRSYGHGKYVNTAETAVYHKSAVLYGMDLITPQTKRAVVVEGNSDVIAGNMACSDDPEVVYLGACGSSLNAKHLDLLSRFDEVSFVFDGDDAGRKALVQQIWVLNKLGNKAKASLLPDGQDPWDVYVGGTDLLSRIPYDSAGYIEMAVTCQWMLTKHSTSDMTDWVRITAPSMVFTAHRDQLIGDVARMLGQSPARWKRELALPIRIETKRSDENQLSPRVRILVSFLMQLPPEECGALLACIRPWDDRVESMLRQWFDVTSDLDVQVIHRLTEGIDYQTTAQIDQILAEFMGNREHVDIGMVVRGVTKQLISEIGSRPSLNGSYITRQVRNIRRCIEASRDTGAQAAVLAYILDTIIDVERLETQSMARIARESEEAPATRSLRHAD